VHISGLIMQQRKQWRFKVFPSNEYWRKLPKFLIQIHAYVMHALILFKFASLRRSLHQYYSVHGRLFNDCGVVDGMRSGRGNRSTRTKPALVPLLPPQIPRDLTWSEPGPTHVPILNVCICLSFQWLFQPIQGPGLLFSSVIIFFKDGRITWTSNQPLPKHRTTETD
jgi:hypothetical protein